MPTDVYAFGSVFYAVSTATYELVRLIKLVQTYFDTVPFQGKSVYQISLIVTDGKHHPTRLDSPTMEDSTWDLIMSCRESSPSQRPKMDDVVQKMTSFIAPH